MSDNSPEERLRDASRELERAKKDIIEELPSEDSYRGNLCHAIMYIGYELGSLEAHPDYSFEEADGEPVRPIYEDDEE